MDTTTLPPLARGRSARIVFTGGRGDFFRLVGRGALLELITAGLYRFWLATDIRRALWSGTSVDGDPPEYTGTAKELLIGFLFALAILVPIYVVYFLIGIEAERTKAFASVPLVLFFYAFGQFAIYRARRYRATRTVWRGVRFWMSGSGWAYSWRVPVELAHVADARPGAAVARECAGTLQDAASALRRPRGALRRHRLGAVQARLVALASVLADRHGSVHLSGVPGRALAMVGVGRPLRRGAFRIRAPGQ
jgi:uncharacterized membrane protein YjgN (DUF898 family)